MGCELVASTGQIWWRIRRPSAGVLGTHRIVFENIVARGFFPGDLSSGVDSVVEVGHSAAGVPLTEEFDVEAGVQW